MATVEELLRAAQKADAAGDTEAARALVQAAKGVIEAPAPKYREQAMDGPMAPPVAYGDNGMAAKPTAPQADRFGDTFNAAIAAPLAAAKTFGAGLMDQSRSPTMQALPEGMNPRLKGMVAGVGDLGGMALSGLGTAFAGAAGLVGEAVGGAPTQETKLARDLMMMGEVAVPELAGVSGTMRAGAKAASAADRISKPATALQESARAASDLGITPALGMGGKVRAMTAATLEKTPVVADMVAKDAARAVGEVEGAFARIRNSIGQSTGAAGAGEALQSGLQSFVQGFKNTSSRLYGEVDNRIPASSRFGLSSTAQSLEDAKAAFAGNPELAAKLGLNKWDAIVSEAGDNGISWPALKQFRTSVGEAIGSLESGKAGGSLASEDLSRLKRLYGGLTSDMEAAAKSAGDEAYSAWSRANNYYKAGSQRIERSLDKTIRADNPERAFVAFQSLLADGRTSSDISRVREIKNSMPKEEWNTVSASIVDRLGKASAGQQNAAGDAFSPSVFLTNWNKMDADARRLLLPEDARIELDKLAKVAESVKASGAERNTSNTGNMIAASALGASAVQAPIATLLTAGGTYLSAKAMTSTTFLKLLNNAARGDSRALTAMANGNGPFAMDAKTVLQIMAAEASQGDPANTSQAPLRAVSQP